MPPAPEDHPDDLVLEALPDEVIASMEVRDAWRQRVAAGGAGLEFIVDGLAGWTAGSTLRVAFLGGTTELHRDIAETTKQITDAANIALDFGENASGQFRRWSESDTSYTAEIRVSFDRGGFFSLVGTDSTDRTIGSRFDAVGGWPHQRSLNLGGFEQQRPAAWQGTVRHEFLHALAFHHEHQNLNGSCQQDFRWEDDPGYVPTQDARGVFVNDAANRRPGIYTFLAGAPNRWSRAKVDHNLRPATGQGLVSSAFDAESVMLYRFAPLFYKSSPSPCAPSGDGINLSAGDRSGLLKLYPHDPQQRAEVASAAKETLTRIGAGQESSGPSLPPMQARVVELLQDKAGS